MKQLTLDIGLASGPTFSNFFPGPNEATLRHLQLWLGERGTQGRLSPVPNYLWGPSGSGKTHLLRAVRARLATQGVDPAQGIGWLDAQTQELPSYHPGWTLVVLDDVHLYTAEQQHAAFNWFVNAQTHSAAVLAAGHFPPTELKLREDLRTRLGWGQVLDFMLNRFSRDLGSLMELLGLLDGYSLQTKRPITIPMIKSMLDNS